MTFDSESYLVVGTQVSFVLFYLFLVLYFQFSSLFSHVTPLLDVDNEKVHYFLCISNFEI